MTSQLKAGLMASLFAMIGLPLLFLAVSLASGVWEYFLFSLFPSFFAGFTGLLFTFQEIRKQRNAK
ncbi:MULTISPECIES: hypothetical protein [Bacillaceae]|uniref:Uncharacterized protein n=1 Tax=Metabacillus sediminis TaxID=3117746 RepID=A0ABZ2NL12_9BACI|nr:hypothetical protein [Bacillus sp. SJS]KZZ83692.1 hypothetical protein AS29_015420 [Bacillus sp. SJS]